MNYKETIEYLYRQLPMFSRIGSAAYKKDLHNTIALCNSLGNPETTFKTIHIAGTNGKGSTSHMIAA
ncbi:MAG: bifunctional folylpolyglutamate synthase/dihydrofolate synthase, partial [Ferruginibacter sp.]|nr:bifunctional folylpolyglutamate synthase/dihydrofolate synthase [Ferruginibacter sp.]